MAFKTLEENLDRIANALESLAASHKESVELQKSNNAIYKERASSEPQTQEPDGNDEERKKLKARLTELKVEFKPRMATETLRALVASAEKALGHQPPAGTPPPAGGLDAELGLGAQAPAAKPLTLDDVKAAFILVRNKDGNSDKITGYLSSRGLTKLSDLKAEDYAASVEWAKKAVA